MPQRSRTSRIPPCTVLLPKSRFATLTVICSAMRVVTKTQTHRQDRFYYLDC